MTMLPKTKMPIQSQEEWLSPDEMELVLEALYTYRLSKDGMRHSGRLTWIREKFVRCKLEGSAIRVYQSGSLER